uniref:YLP motif-containing protein 1 n=1 Tax=Anthurium amnicola TaxID=1678845 RepID=A0A1D1ZF89_9ARAE
MDESWRFLPATDNVCPTCRVSHVPFCPPPRHLYSNGFPPDDPRRYPVETAPFHRPLPAPPPFTEHRRMSPPPLLHHLNPMAPRNVESWNGLSLMEREPFRQPFQSTERLFPDEFLEREKFHKRMRVGDDSPGYPASPQRPDRFGLFSKGISSEDERRLNLIRDHGRSHLNLPFDVERRRNGEYFPVDRHPHIGPLSHYAWKGPDRDLNGPGLGPSVDNDQVTPNSTLFNLKNQVLRGSSFGGYRDLAGAPDFQNPDKSIHSEVKDFQTRDWDASNIVRLSSSHAEISREPYGHSDVPSHPLRSYGYSDIVTESSKSHMVHDLDLGSIYKKYFSEDFISNSQKQVPHSPSHAYKGSQQMLNQQQHLQQTGVSEPQYPRADSYEVPFKLNAGHHGHIDHAVHEHVGHKYETYVHESEVPVSFERIAPFREDSFRPLDLQPFHLASQSNVHLNQRGHLPMQSSSNMIPSMGCQVQLPQTSPPPPPQPLPSPPPEPSSSYHQVSSSISTGPPPVTPIPVGFSVDVSRSYTGQGLSEAPAASKTHFYNEPPEKTSNSIVMERRAFIPQPLPKQHPEEGHAFSPKHVLKDKRTVVDASHIFCQPFRATRPDHIAVILRGLPGSGKSYLAKALRDLEVDNGGNAPRIHCMDDYFMAEVEKVEESDGSKSSGSVKGKKQVTKMVMEYCYEPEMEEAYRSSMLKAFKKTVEDGIFTFVIGKYSIFYFALIFKK